MMHDNDLDWLARNVHNWLDGMNYICVDRDGGGCIFGKLTNHTETWFSREQWLARRAELQNKPSWESAPEWAEWLAQDGRDGVWFWIEIKPNPHDGEAKVWDIDESGANAWAGRGSVLGDWRDTLERRQDPVKQFTRIEDNQEISVSNQDDWFDLGELPPVGEFVDVEGDDLVYGDGEINCEVLAHFEDVAIIRMSYGLGCFQASVLSPSRTERERAITEMMRVAAENWGNLQDCCERLYDAGYRRDPK